MRNTDIVKTIAEQVVTTTELALLLDVDVRHITRLRDAGIVIAADGRGKWEMGNAQIGKSVNR